jgi:cytochrome P450
MLSDLATAFRQEYADRGGLTGGAAMGLMPGELPYLEACIKEGLRLYPAASQVGTHNKRPTRATPGLSSWSKWRWLW